MGILIPYVKIRQQLLEVPNPWDNVKYDMYCAWLAQWYPEQITQGDIWRMINGQRAPWHASRFNDAYMYATNTQGWLPPTFKFDASLNLLVDSNSINTLDPDAGFNSGGTPGRPARPGKINPLNVGKPGTISPKPIKAGFSVAPFILVIAVSLLLKFMGTNK